MNPIKFFLLRDAYTASGINFNLRLFGNNNGNITNLNISEKSNDFFDMIFVIELRDLNHLNFIIEKLKENEIVSDVKRLFID